MWRLNPRSSLHYRRWDNAWAVFDVGSGQTHEMDSLSAVALMCCENGWTSLPKITAVAISDLELPPDACVAELLLPLLQQFSRLGLLEYRAE